MAYDNRGGGRPIVSNSPVIPPDFGRIDREINDLGQRFVKECFPWHSKFNTPDVTVTQIRKLLSAVNMIQNKLSADEKKYNPGEIQYLRIKLAYQAGRERKLKRMQEELDPVIAKISSAKDFKIFARLIESIVAYHKFYGGSN